VQEQLARPNSPDAEDREAERPTSRRAHLARSMSAGEDDTRINSTAPTRDRILSAASQELARAGFAGARMESIARLAGVRKQVIYYYFPSKADLAREVLAVSNQNAADFWESFQTATLGEIVRAAIERAHDSPHDIAHLIWEGQESQNDHGLHVPMADPRARDMRLIVDLIERSQRAGDVDADLPGDLLALCVVMLSLGPAAYPQLVPVLTGSDWTSPQFTERWADFCVRAVATLMNPR
jgi:AcrR family transcriptional regulator